MILGTQRLAPATTTVLAPPATVLAPAASLLQPTGQGLPLQSPALLSNLGKQVYRLPEYEQADPTKSLNTTSMDADAETPNDVTPPVSHMLPLNMTLTLPNPAPAAAMPPFAGLRPSPSIGLMPPPGHVRATSPPAVASHLRPTSPPRIVGTASLLPAAHMVQPSLALRPVTPNRLRNEPMLLPQNAPSLRPQPALIGTGFVSPPMSAGVVREMSPPPRSLSPTPRGMVSHTLPLAPQTLPSVGIAPQTLPPASFSRTFSGGAPAFPQAAPLGEYANPSAFPTAVYPPAAQLPAQILQASSLSIGNLSASSSFAGHHPTDELRAQRITKVLRECKECLASTRQEMNDVMKQRNILWDSLRQAEADFTQSTHDWSVVQEELTATRRALAISESRKMQDFDPQRYYSRDHRGRSLSPSPASARSSPLAYKSSAGHLLRQQFRSAAADKNPVREAGLQWICERVIQAIEKLLFAAPAEVQGVAAKVRHQTASIARGVVSHVLDQFADDDAVEVRRRCAPAMAESMTAVIARVAHRLTVLEESGMDGAMVTSAGTQCMAPLVERVFSELANEVGSNAVFDEECQKYCDSLKHELSRYNLIDASEGRTIARERGLQASSSAIPTMPLEGGESVMTVETFSRDIFRLLSAVENSSSVERASSFVADKGGFRPSNVELEATCRAEASAKDSNVSAVARSVLMNAYSAAGNASRQSAPRQSSAQAASLYIQALTKNLIPRLCSTTPPSMQTAEPAAEPGPADYSPPSKMPGSVGRPLLESGKQVLLAVAEAVYSDLVAKEGNTLEIAEVRRRTAEHIKLVAEGTYTPPVVTPTGSAAALGLEASSRTVADSDLQGLLAESRAVRASTQGLLLETHAASGRATPGSQQSSVKTTLCEHPQQQSFQQGGVEYQSFQQREEQQRLEPERRNSNQLAAMQYTRALLTGAVSKLLANDPGY